jgi:hypothetical protein
MFSAALSPSQNNHRENDGDDGKSGFVTALISLCPHFSTACGQSAI